jgi:hypothetical protein
MFHFILFRKFTKNYKKLISVSSLINKNFVREFAFLLFFNRRHLLYNRRFLRLDQDFLFSIIKFSFTSPNSDSKRSFNIKEVPNPHLESLHYKFKKSFQENTKQSFVLRNVYYLRHLEVNHRNTAVTVLPVPSLYYYILILDQPYLWSSLLTEIYSHFRR